MKDWTEELISPSNLQERKLPNICSKIFKKGWFPQDGVIKISENGSMEMELITSVIAQTNRSFRKVVLPEVDYLL